MTVINAQEVQSNDLITIKRWDLITINKALRIGEYYEDQNSAIWALYEGEMQETQNLETQLSKEKINHTATINMCNSDKRDWAIKENMFEEKNKRTRKRSFLVGLGVGVATMITIGILAN